MSELRFSSEQEALQYLSDKTGKQIKIAADENAQALKDQSTAEAFVRGIADSLDQATKDNFVYSKQTLDNFLSAIKQAFGHINS